MALRALTCALVAALLLAPSALAQPHPGYRIPADNPYVATPGASPEIYVRGMRNPYRWSFDRPTGDMYVADVGGNRREEIDYLPRARIAGANLGWNCLEGTLTQKGCRPPGYFPPVWEYPSSPDVVIGGYVVHDPDLPSFQGRYLYGQYLTGLWVLGPGGTGPAVRVSTGIFGVTSFGEDGAGRIYATAYDGQLYRLGESAGALTVTQLAMFERLLARPMQMRNYYIGLRDDDAYGGGGWAFTSRDFMKMAQLVANKGRWNGRQLVSEDWVRRSTAPLHNLGTSAIQQYGFLWNSVEYDYNGRKIRAYFAGGNGGQVSMATPDLDLVIAFTGGNYNDSVLFTGQRVYVPTYILPAVRMP